MDSFNPPLCIKHHPIYALPHPDQRHYLLLVANAEHYGSFAQAESWRAGNLHDEAVQCRVLGLEFYVGPPRETDERPAQSLPSIPSELHEENTVLPSDIVRESGLSRADRRLLGYVETVLGALDDPDFRAAWVSLTRFAHKRLTSGRRSGRDAAQYPPARASCPR